MCVYFVYDNDDFYSKFTPPDAIDRDGRDELKRTSGGVNWLLYSAMMYYGADFCERLPRSVTVTFK